MQRAGANTRLTAGHQNAGRRTTRKRTPVFALVALGTVLAGCLLAFSCEGRNPETAGSAGATTDSAAPVEVSDSQEPEVDSPEPEDEPADDSGDTDKAAAPEAETPAVSARSVAHEFVTGGDAATPLQGTQAYADFAEAVGSIEDAGYEVSVVVYCPDTESGFSYNADQQYYSASTIKAPFVAALYQTQVDGGKLPLDDVDGTVEQTIVNSDNVCYRKLRDSYSDCFGPWLKSNDVDLGKYGSYQQMSTWYYLTLNPSQLAQMWIGIYGYLSEAQTPAATQLKGYLEERTTSPLRDALGDKYTTWGKAGWFYEDSDYDSAPCANEAGVVFADKPCIVAVMSTEEANLEALEPVFAAVDELHGLYAG